ncbi:Ig-like domain-containing protein [Planctomycetota bacterium]
MFLIKCFTQLMRESRRWRRKNWFLTGLILAVSAGLAFGALGQIGSELKFQDSDRPKVVSVVPADGVTVVGPEVDVRIKFDRPMNPYRTDLSVTRDRLLHLKEAHYDEKEHEFVYSFELESGCDYSFKVNRGIASVFAIRGFQDRAKNIAVTFEWNVRVQEVEVREGESAANVVSVKLGGEGVWPLFSMIRIKFDQPMETIFRPTIEHAPGVRFNRGMIFTNHINYDPESYEFVMPLLLPPNWSGPVMIGGFRGRNGLMAAPVSLGDVVTGSEIYSVDFVNRMQKAGQAGELIQVLEMVKQKRRQLQSVTERVHTYSTSSLTNSIDSVMGEFKMQGERQFFGNLNQASMGLLLIGSDGESCWKYSGRDDSVNLVMTDYDEIAEKNLGFCDPFLLMEREPSEAIEALKLEYLGTDEWEGKLYHLVRSWWIEISGSKTYGTVYVWWIDSSSYMVRRIEIDQGSSQSIRDYEYYRINEYYDISEFRPDFATGIEPQGPRPMENGCNRRYLDVADGSNNEMSGYWGMKGEGIKIGSGYGGFIKR